MLYSLHSRERRRSFIKIRISVWIVYRCQLYQYGSKGAYIKGENYHRPAEGKQLEIIFDELQVCQEHFTVISRTEWRDTPPRGGVFPLQPRSRQPAEHKRKVCTRYKLLSNFLSRCPGSRGPQRIREKRCYIDHRDWISSRGSRSYPWAVASGIPVQDAHNACLIRAGVMIFFMTVSMGNDVTRTCIATLDECLHFQRLSAFAFEATQPFAPSPTLRGK